MTTATDRRRRPGAPARTTTGAVVLCLLVVVVGSVAAGTAVAPRTATAAVGTPGATPSPVVDRRGVGQSDGPVRLYRGPGTLASSVEGTAALRRAVGDELRRSDGLVVGDLLAVRVESDRLTALLAGSGRDATDRFFGRVETTGLDFAVVESSPGPSRRQSELLLTRTNTRVLQDTGNDTVWILIDTGQALLRNRDGGDPLDRTIDDYEFEARLTVPDPAGDGDDRTLTASGALFAPSAAVTDAGAGLAVGAAQGVVGPNATRVTLHGATNHLPGTPLTVRAVRPNGTVVAERRVRARPGNATVADRPTPSPFAADLNLTALSSDDRVRLVVSDGERALSETTLFVGRPATVTNVSARLLAGGDGNRTARVGVRATVRVPDDGLLVVGDEAVSVPEDETVETLVYVDPGAVSPGGRMPVRVAWDRDGDGDRDEGEPVFEAVGRADRPENDTTRLVAVAGLPTPTADPTTAATTERSSTSLRGPTLAPRDGGESLPGFGTGATVAAVVGTLAVWRRRREE